ncbi:unnamed protein product [Absidia cylindrospora]
MASQRNPNEQERQQSTSPSIAESTRTSRLFIVIVCVLFRWWNAYLTRTYDNPDEYWQAPEVAHRLVFGYGYLTWEWTHHIRSFFHPLVFAFLYKCLAWCHLDSPSLLITAPRYFQATISAFGDVATHILAKKIYGNRLAPFILFVTLSSWFNFLMAPRTLSNTMETVFTVIAMKSWPFPGTATTIHWLSDYRKSLLWASLACITRPTNALIWGFLGLQLLYHTPSSNHQRWTILVNAVLILSILLMLNVIVDTYFYTGKFPQFHSFRYQDLVFVPWTFIKTNVFQSIAIFYGAHPFHWYVTQGLPLMLLSFLPLTIIGMVTGTSTTATALASSSLKQLVLCVVFVYSLLSHKEFRFIYPIFPLLMIFTAHGLSITWQKLGAHVKRRWCLVIILWMTQLILALYVSLWHQRGVMDVMIWLRQQQQPPMSVGFLMPCHSTPWHSVMHQTDRRDDDMMWFLTCEPPLQTTLLENNNNSLDQADLFYRDPVTFLSNFSSHPWPTTLVMFEHLLAQPGITHLLVQEKGYVECQRFFNSHMHWDKRRKGDVVVLCASS